MKGNKLGPEEFEREFTVDLKL